VARARVRGARGQEVLSRCVRGWAAWRAAIGGAGAGRARAGRSRPGRGAVAWCGRRRDEPVLARARCARVGTAGGGGERAASGRRPGRRAGARAGKAGFARRVRALGPGARGSGKGARAGRPVAGRAGRAHSGGRAGQGWRGVRGSGRERGPGGVRAALGEGGRKGRKEREMEREEGRDSRRRDVTPAGHARRSLESRRDSRRGLRPVGHARVARRGGWDNGCSGQRNDIGIWDLGF